MLSDLLASQKLKFIDLTLPLKNNLPYRTAPVIKYEDHKAGAAGFRQRLNLPENGFFALGYANDVITLSSHSGTHLDAPWHYAPTSEGRPAKTIDQIPLEWCCGAGVILNFAHKKKGELITPDELVKALQEIRYILKPGNIVLIRTDCCRHYEKAEYQYMHPGMSREGTLWLIDHGIKVMGTDAWGWDASMDVQAEKYKKGDKEQFWASHYLGKEREYCHLEKMCNLDQLPDYGFLVFVFPLKISGGSGSPVRAVAMVES